MAEENPPSNDPQDEADKSQTIRITLPAKTDGPVAKRETVRVNIPESAVQPPPQAPKKETSKVTIPGGSATLPSAPRPPGPPMPPAGAPPLRPLSGTTPPPKPPSLSGKPTVPLKPAPPVPQSGIARPGSGIVAKPASPKKETARISLPTESPKGGGPALPKATVKMQQTQPLSKSQPSGVRPQTMTTVASVSSAPVTSSSSAKADTATLVLSILAFVGAAAAAVFAFLVFTAAKLPDWIQP